MFDNYCYNANSTKNVVKNNQVEGFQFQTFITYYRGIPLSMVHNIKVNVDGTEIPRELLLFSPNGNDYFTLDEMETCGFYKWEYGTPATIFVKQPGGLSKGEHEVTFTLAIRVAYIPVPFGATRTRKVIIE